MNRTVSLSPEQIEALYCAIRLALGDQKQYLDNGNPELDYASEWPDVAEGKARDFEHLAGVARCLGWPGLADECIAFSDRIRSWFPEDAL